MALSPSVSQRLTTFISTEHHTVIERLAGFITSGQVAPVIGQRFNLDGVPEAMRQLAAGDANAKTAIIVRPTESNQS